MKILVSTPSNSQDKYFRIINNSVQLLKKHGHKLSETFGGEKLAQKTLLKNDQLIKDCDVLVAEITTKDPKISYEIARAIDSKKIIIILCDDKLAENNFLGKLSQGNKNIVCINYNSKNLNEVLLEGISTVSGKLDSKFILIMPSQIDRYLNWASQNKKIHKAQIVRKALEQFIKRDKDYKKKAD